MAPLPKRVRSDLVSEMKSYIASSLNSPAKAAAEAFASTAGIVAVSETAGGSSGSGGGGGSVTAADGSTATGADAASAVAVRGGGRWVLVSVYQEW